MKQSLKCSEHGSDVLNRASTISQAAIDNITQRPLMDELATDPHLMKLLQQSRNFPVEMQQDQMRLLPKFASTVAKTS